MVKSKRNLKCCCKLNWENSSDGYILELKLEYPHELNDFDNDYQLAPEKIEIRNDISLKHCSEIAK